MKISLITINRNNASGLRATLDSVARQLEALPAGVELEHIIVDGESTDGSAGVVDGRVGSMVVTAPPQGPYNAMNVGMRVATGDVIGLLHSGDCFTAADALAMIAARFMAGDAPDFVWGDVTIGGRRYYSGKKYTCGKLSTGYAPPHPTLYLSRKALHVVGYYDERYTIAADFDYFVRLLKSDGVEGTYMPGALVDMSAGGVSSNWRNVLWTNNREIRRILRSHGIKTTYLRLMSRYFSIVYGYFKR